MPFSLLAGRSRPLTALTRLVEGSPLPCDTNGRSSLLSALALSARQNSERTEASTPARLPEIFERALAAKNMLEDGETVLVTARKADDLEAFSMGHMLHHIITKGLLIDPGNSARAILQDIAKNESNGGAAIRNRHRLIAAMKRAGAVERKLHDKIFKPSGTIPSVRSIALVTGKEFNIGYEDIISSSRACDTVKARFRAIWVMRAICGHSLTAIGGHFGNRDHTTVLNAINKINVEIADVARRDAMEALCEEADILGVRSNIAMLGNTRMISIARS